MLMLMYLYGYCAWDCMSAMYECMCVFIFDVYVYV